MDDCISILLIIHVLSREESAVCQNDCHTQCLITCSLPSLRMGWVQFKDADFEGVEFDNNLQKSGSFLLIGPLFNS